MRPFRLFVTVLCTVLTCLSFAHIEPARERLLTESKMRLLDKAENLPIVGSRVFREPNTVVLMTISTCKIDIIAKCSEVNQSEKLAKALDQSLKSINGVGFRYFDTKEVSEVVGARNTGRFLQMQASQQVDLGEVVNSLRQAGFKAIVLLRVGNYLQPTIDPYPQDTSKNYTYWNVSDAKQGSKVSLHSEISASTLFGLAFFCVGYLLIGCIGLIAAPIVARRSDIPLNRRRVLYHRYVTMPAIGGILVHFPFFIWFTSSGNLKRITDLWFGSTSATMLFMVASLAGLGLMMLVLKRVTNLEKDLFGEAAPEVQQVIDQETKSKKNVQRKVVWFVRLPFFLLFIGYIFLSNYLGWYRNSSIEIPLAVIIFFVVSQIAERELTKKIEPPVFESEDTQRLQSLVQEVATQMNVKVKPATVLNTGVYKAIVFARVTLTGVISVSQGALDHLDDNELKALIAHECGHLQSKNRWLLILSVIHPIVFGIGMFTLIPLVKASNGNFGSIYIYMACIMAIGFVPIIFISRVRKQREFDADRRALEFTRDLVPIESAWKKMTKYSLMPGAHEVDDLSTHPAMSKRLATLRQHALEMGLRLTPEEQLDPQ